MKIVKNLKLITVFGVWGEGLFIFREFGSTAYYYREAGGKHILLGI